MLFRSNVHATYKLLNTDGSVAGQTTAPIIFLDQASSQWRAPITETPKSQQAKPGSITTVLAVANVSDNPQAVIVKLFDASGNLVASGRTPTLGRAQGGAGGEFAFTLSPFLGIELTPNPGSTEFRGTVNVEGEGGGNIVPVVLRVSLPGLITETATAEIGRAHV